MKKSKRKIRKHWHDAFNDISLIFKPLSKNNQSGYKAKISISRNRPNTSLRRKIKVKKIAKH